MDVASHINPKADPFKAASEAGAEAGTGRQRQGLALGLLAAIIWGGYLAVSRSGIAAGLTAADLAFLRYVPAGVLLLPWLVTHAPLNLAGVGWGRGVILTFLLGPLFVLVGASGFHFAPLAHSAVIQLGSVTLMGILLSALLTGDRPGRQRLVGMMIIIAGLAITAGPGLFEGGSSAWIGDLLFATAGTMWAAFAALQRRWNLPPIASTAAVSVLSCGIYAPSYLLFHGPENLLAVGPAVLAQQAIVLGLLSGVVALFAFARAIEYLGPGKASLFPALAPAVAILLGIPISGEIPNYGQIAGLILLSAGLLQSMRIEHPNKP
ncbi:DMT family transporter [Rhizobium leguminosarum]|uniref:DMT family transporter n=1 Tax=Rhizobium TaxID=379 RepID=UPI0013EEDC69|nr:DMT family transporter [Rhizobium leguminosarum]